MYAPSEWKVPIHGEPATGHRPPVTGIWFPCCRWSVKEMKDSVFHLLGRFVRERNRQYRLGRGVFFDKVQDSARNDARFPRSGAGNDKKRSFCVENRFFLPLV